MTRERCAERAFYYATPLRKFHSALPCQNCCDCRMYKTRTARNRLVLSLLFETLGRVCTLAAPPFLFRLTPSSLIIKTAPFLLRRRAAIDCASFIQTMATIHR